MHAHTRVHYSTDLQVAVMCQEKQKCANTHSEEEDCYVFYTFKNANYRKKIILRLLKINIRITYSMSEKVLYFLFKNKQSCDRT